MRVRNNFQIVPIPFLRIRVRPPMVSEFVYTNLTLGLLGIYKVNEIFSLVDNNNEILLSDGGIFSEYNTNITY